MNLADCDPFRYLTIAGVCQNIYLAKNMPKNTICVNKDYSENKNNCSLKSLQWITYLEKLHNTFIQSAFSGKEVTINISNDIYKVDDYDKENNIIYEFHGCYV